MAATYYDRRAERTAAQAEADATRAAAEATRAETALRVERERRRMEDAASAADRHDRIEHAEHKASRRRARRTERKRARAALAAATRRGAGALVATVLTRAPVVVGGIAMGAPIAIAWRGQLEFAEKVMHLGVLAPALPIALEGAAWYLAFLTHRAIKAHLPAGGYRAWTWGLASLAAAMNLWHGWKAYGPQAGVVLALASLLGILLWELTASLAVQTESKRSAAEIRRAAWRRVRYPRLSWAAVSIRAARGEDCTTDQAWVAAWIDRYGIGPDASQRDRKLARSILRHQSKADRRAAKDGRLSIVEGAILGRPEDAHVPEVARVPDPEPDPRAERAMANLKEFGHRVNGGMATSLVPARTLVLDRAPVPMSREVYDWTAAGGLFDSPPREVAPAPADLPAQPVDLPAETPILGPVPDELCPVAAERYAGDLAEGKVPALSRIKKDLRIGQPRAARIRTYLTQLAH